MILAIFCVWSLPNTTTTIADKWLRNLRFPDKNRCIIVNGWGIIYLGARQL